jgi:hypothetical protein
MAWNEFYKYLAVMLMMAFITLGLILYAIFKNDYSKKIDIAIKTMVLIDLIIVTIIFLKLWF